MGDFEKKFPASAYWKKKIACNRKLMGKKGKKYPAHQIAKKKQILDDQKSPTPSPQELNGRPLHILFCNKIIKKRSLPNLFTVRLSAPVVFRESFPTAESSVHQRRRILSL